MVNLFTVSQVAIKHLCLHLMACERFAWGRRISTS